MKLIVGLGNPGSKYEMTRHNAGFILVDLLVSAAGESWQGQKWQAEIAKITLHGEKCLCLKPQTFMNLSGKSVSAAAKFHKIEPSDIFVIYDDIDMPSGKVKTRRGGGHGGHNGVRSVMGELGSAEFTRIKLGVGRPQATEENPDGDRVPVTNWVLGKMNEAELRHLETEMLDGVLLRLKEQFGSC